MSRGNNHVLAATNWNVVTLQDLEGIESIRSIWEQMQNAEPSPAPNADIYRYLACLNATSDTARPHIILFKRDDNPAAMIIGRIEKYKINLKLGYISIPCPRSRCYRVVYGGILGQPDDELCSLLVGELTKQMRQRQFDMISFNHLKTNTPFYQTIRKIPGFFTRDHSPIINEHWHMTVPDNIKQFYSAHSHGHRHNLRRAIRKFEEECYGKSKLVNYSSAGDVDNFLKVAADISSKTYQNRLGVGLVNDEKTKSRLLAEAAKGWFRGHILYSGDIPCAFQLSLQYRNIYYMENIGYDPALSSCKPGLILFLKVLESLCADPSIDVIDFYFGDAEYKHRYGTEHWPEAWIYMFAPRPCPILINTMRISAAGVNAGLKYVVNMFSSTDRIKSKWRHLLQTKNTAVKSQRAN
jgi:hypothetical protein